MTPLRAAGAVLLSLGLVACGSAHTAEPVALKTHIPTSTSTPSPTKSPKPAKAKKAGKKSPLLPGEKRFVKDVRSHFPGMFDKATDEQIASLNSQVCLDINMAGMSKEATAQDFVDMGLPRYIASGVVFYALQDACTVTKEAK